MVFSCTCQPRVANGSKDLFVALQKVGTCFKNVSIPMSIEFFTIGISVRLSDKYLHREEQKESSKIVPRTETRTDHEANALPTELSQHSVASLSLHAFIKSCSIDSRNEQSPTCEVVHETNKAHFRNLLPNRSLA